MSLTVTERYVPEDARRLAAQAANAADANVWRWFSSLYESGRLRWCRSSEGWLVSVDHRHVATDPDFDSAIREAMVNAANRSSCRK